MTFFSVPIMPVITFNLQLNTYLSALKLLISSLKTEALNNMPFKCLICNYLLKCFLHVSAMRVWICSSIYLRTHFYIDTVHLALLTSYCSPVVILRLWKACNHIGWCCQSLETKLPCSATKVMRPDSMLELHLSHLEHFAGRQRQYWQYFKGGWAEAPKEVLVALLAPKHIPVRVPEARQTPSHSLYIPLPFLYGNSHTHPLSFFAEEEPSWRKRFLVPKPFGQQWCSHNA